MNTSIKLIIALIVTVTVTSCSPLAFGQKGKIKANDYTVKAIPDMTGKNGTVIFKVFSYGKNAKRAIETGKRNAVHAVLMKGIPGTNFQQPLLNSANAIKKNEKYFEDFFGVKNLVKWKREKRKVNPKYLLYVDHLDVGIDPDDVMQVGRYKRVGIAYRVQYLQLQKQLEEDGILEKSNSNRIY
jgi:hypothetical protein